MILRLLLFISISILCNTAIATNHDTRSYVDKHFDFAGYIGYQFVYGSPKPSPLETSPEVGFLVNYTINDNWTAFTQLRLETDHVEQSLAYAFIEYSNKMFDNIPYRISAGKLRHQYGLYNKDRLNPRTRPGNVAPQAIYWDQLRFALTSGHGVSFAASWNNFHFKYTIDRPIVIDEREEAIIWFSGQRVDLKQKWNGHQLINLDYIGSDWRAGASVAFQDWGYGAAGKNKLITLGVERRVGDLTLSLEAMGVLKYVNNSYAVSATAQYDWTDMISTHINYNRYYIIFKDDHPAQDQYFAQSDDVSVGLTLHLDDWELRSEVHAAKGSVWVDFEKARDPKFEDWWYYGALSIVYHF